MHRKPTSGPLRDGPFSASMASGPADMLSYWPPRIHAPGSSVVLTPTRHWASPVELTIVLHWRHVSERGPQSATHSITFPTMSTTPTADTQRLRDPVGIRIPLAVLQVVAPSSGPGSGVPATAACHSAFDGSLLPALAH